MFRPPTTAVWAIRGVLTACYSCSPLANSQFVGDVLSVQLGKALVDADTCTAARFRSMSEELLAYGGSMLHLRALIWMLLLCMSGYAAPMHAQPVFLQFREHEEGEQNRAADEPLRNPHPSKALVLKGRKDPRIEIWVDFLYSTTNGACLAQSLIGHIAGAPNVPQTVRDAVRVPVGKSEFTARFFLDQYLPGSCGWEPMVLGNTQYIPGSAPGPISREVAAITRAHGGPSVHAVLVCHQKPITGAEKEASRLDCYWQGPYSEDGKTLSTDGGSVQLEVTLE